MFLTFHRLFTKLDPVRVTPINQTGKAATILILIDTLLAISKICLSTRPKVSGSFKAVLLVYLTRKLYPTLALKYISGFTQEAAIVPFT